MAAWIDPHARAVGPVEDQVVRARRRLPLEDVLEPGAAAGLDADAEAAGFDMLFLEQFLDLIGGVCRDDDHEPTCFLNTATGMTPGTAAGVMSAARSAIDVAASAETMRSLICQSGSRMLHFEY